MRLGVLGWPLGVFGFGGPDTTAGAAAIAVGSVSMLVAFAADTRTWERAHDPAERKLIVGREVPVGDDDERSERRHGERQHADTARVVEEQRGGQEDREGKQ